MAATHTETHTYTHTESCTEEKENQPNNALLMFSHSSHNKKKRPHVQFVTFKAHSSRQWSVGLAESPRLPV